MVINLIWNLITWIAKLWDALPKEKKEAIIATVADAFEDLIRHYYRQWRESQGD